MKFKKVDIERRVIGSYIARAIQCRERDPTGRVYLCTLEADAMKACSCLLAAVLGCSTFLSPQSRPSSKAQVNEAAEFDHVMRDPTARKQIVFIVQMALGQMGYGTGPFNGILSANDVKAVVAFRAKAGLPEKQEPFDFAAVQAIEQAWTQIQKPAVMMTQVQVSTDVWDSYVVAEGTWLIEGQEQGIPIQTSEIQCYKHLGQCIEAVAMLDGDFLASWLEIHEIERWDDVEIITKRDLTQGCVRYTMRISRSQKSATALRAKTKNSEECKMVQSADLRLRLGDGREALRGYDAKRQEAFRKYVQAEVETVDVKSKP